MRYNALQKRKIYLDAIALGLEDFKICSAIKYFPELFAVMFTASTDVVASDVLGIIRFPDEMTQDRL